MTTTPPPLPEPAAPAPAPASSSWAQVSAPRWGTDLPIPHHCTLHPTGGLTTTDLRTALITAVTTGTVLDLNPHPNFELDEGTHYLHPPGTTLDTLESDRTNTDQENPGEPEANGDTETDLKNKYGPGNTEQNPPASSIAGWTPTNHPTIPAHWIRTILQGHTPPTNPQPTTTDADSNPGEPTP